MLTLLMQATNPLLRAPYLPLKAVSPASYTGCCWKKGSLSTCQLIDGVEGASLDQHCCNAPPSMQRALASVLSVPHESTPRRHLHAFLRQCWRCRDCYTGLYKDPRCVWNGCGKCFFWCRSASILGPPKESSSTSVNCATQHKRLALQLSLSPCLLCF